MAVVNLRKSNSPLVMSVVWQPRQTASGTARVVDCRLSTASTWARPAPWHASQFNVTDGRIVSGPTTFPAVSYEVRVTDGDVEVRAASKQAAILAR